MGARRFTLILDMWFYLGGIISQTGVAILAVGLGLLRVFELDVSRAHKFEIVLALVASVLLLAGVCVQISQLLLPPVPPS
jgi:hypothetical protein